LWHEGLAKAIFLTFAVWAVSVLSEPRYRVADYLMHASTTDEGMPSIREKTSFGHLGCQSLDSPRLVTPAKFLSAADEPQLLLFRFVHRHAPIVSRLDAQARAIGDHRLSRTGALRLQWERNDMPQFDRITRNPEVMGGKPCLRGMRVTVGTIVGLVASGHSDAEILAAYSYLQAEDIRQALAYAAWRVEEIEVRLPAA
jgi:uncharacterized protein (DUF433 family)